MQTIHELTDLLERSFHGGAWHGPAVAETLEGVDAEAAARRPIAAAHSIWEIVHHLTAWNDVPRRRIDGERDGVLSEGKDWPAVPEPTEENWQQSLEALRTAHRRLHTRLTQLTDEELPRAVAGSESTVGGMVLGVIQHNAYHGGQIVVLRKAKAE
jgi:uncharacterized damage-inducible protein DinB